MQFGLLLVDGSLKPLLHQTLSHYVLKNVAERALSAWERSGCSSNVLRSVDELHGRAGMGTGRVLQNVDSAQTCLAAIPYVPQLNGVTA